MIYNKALFFLPLVASVILPSTVAADPPKPLRFPASTNEDAWKHLPREKPPLPAWALILVESLPKTTAAMLHLDYVHREKNPLGPVLYGKIRWVAADTNRCAYSKSYAEADLKRAGVSEAELKKLVGAWKDLPEEEQLVLQFARKMSRAAYTVTDDEVAALLKQLGPDKLVAIVHTLAHANFQDRVFLALGVEVETGGPLPPLDLKLDPDAKIVVPERLAAARNEGLSPLGTQGQPGWLGKDTQNVQSALNQQKERKPRIPLPSMDRLAAFPPEVQKRSSKIVWSRVSLGYSPLLTQAWFDCMNTWGKEAKLDDVFANTFFWVITRSNECFY